MKSRLSFAILLCSIALTFLSFTVAAPSASAQIQVLAADPPSAEQGTVNLDVLIKGKGFKKGALAKWFVTGTTDTGGVRVNSTTFVDAATLRANIDVSDLAVLSKYDIVVANSDGRTGKGIELFTVAAKGGGNQACTLPAPLLTASTTCTTGSGCVDVSFGTGGIAFSNIPGSGEAIAIQPWDQKIVVAGAAVNSAGLRDYAIFRYNPDGTFDATFGDNGIVRVPLTGDAPFSGFYAKAVALQPDGKIVVAGDRFWIVRLNPDGSLDTGFGTEGKVQLFASLASTAYEIALQGDGKIVIVGRGNGTRKSTTAWHIARLTSTGVPDTSFRNGGQLVLDQYGGGANAVIIQRIKVGTAEEERILVGGQGKSAGNSTGMDFTLMRFNTNGTMDGTFGSMGSGVVLTDVCGGINYVRGVTLDAANNIIAAGGTNLVGDWAFTLARYTANGVLDTTFGGKGTGVAIANVFPGDSDDLCQGVAIQTDGKILMGGAASLGYNFGLVRYNPDGTLDDTFGVGGAAAIYTAGGGNKIAIQPWDGKIVQAGYENLSGGTHGFQALIRYLP